MGPGSAAHHALKRARCAASGGSDCVADRDLWLEQQGFRVLRFWNNEVLNNTGGVLEVTIEHLGRTSPAPSPGATVVAPPSRRLRSFAAWGRGEERSLTPCPSPIPSVRKFRRSTRKATRSLAALPWRP
ncbi:DUF559 domain-containing protein [Tardiphaga sp.]|uniref:DUF559 domain-containing protein n=1 Tax=Tardiphaga sp. TaxID=1926292 RepID=UPI0026371003|nr:DUF559 domain-containing protein [Tardiphaga sp.]